ncbi:hypothetical protein FP026_08450 [Rhizobium tropici]|uniref:Uncharacterized protein n=1 Tax=Rhizobium tropici TaxID=398 RepID=A0A5B0W5M1_RHITR|nr:hypothetical protein [Rhizobium tropici]KAA1182107.1 hypothetical protein FP026_08450 [Rhizobium tropici]
MIELLHVDDTLSEAKIFTHAIYLAAAGLNDKQDINAIQVIACEISDRLSKARDMLDEIREKPTSVADLDPSRMLEAIRAEKTRRAALKAAEDNANG